MFDTILDLQIWFNSSLSEFNSFARESPLVAGVVSVWFLGVISILFRGLPKKVLVFLKRNLILEGTIHSSTEFYYEFLSWYSSKGHVKRARVIKFESGMYGESETVKTLGYGNHFFWYEGSLILVKLEREGSNGVSKDKSLISLFKIGRSNKVFDCLMKEIKNSSKESDSTEIKYWESDRWRLIIDQSECGRASSAVGTVRDGEGHNLCTACCRSEGCTGSW